MTWLALLWVLLFPARVQYMGYCPDVMSPSCEVRTWWPKSRWQEATGTEAYWLMDGNRRVCFVTRWQYAQSDIGRDADCLWRERPL